MMRRASSMVALIGLLTLILLTAVFPAGTAHANFFDRIQDIYQAPDKIDEIQRQYSDANEELTKQLEQYADTNDALSQQLQQSQTAVDQLAKRQEEMLEQNEKLMEQNAALQAELESVREKKEALQRKLRIAGIALACCFAGYFAAVRLWRYWSWRRHKRLGGM